jgi:hypothetical protein
VKRVVVSNFYDVYIGDIAFLTTILGMESSEACWCLLCYSGTNIFNCDSEDCVSKQRTVQNMYACLLKYLHKSRTSTSLKNIDGVNNSPLVPADVTKVIVPILHCPMGLVDKLIQAFLTTSGKRSFFYHRQMTWYGKSFKRRTYNSHLRSHFFSQRKPRIMNPKQQKIKQKLKGFK